jgi:hypothetical protein
MPKKSIIEFLDELASESWFLFHLCLIILYWIV